MNIDNEQPNIKKYFKTDNLVEQPIYKSKQKYTVIYINPILYEELFNEKYEYDTAIDKLSNYFSITLDKRKSDGNIVSTSYADKQFDPMGISLSGNLGSGRAFFYNKYFNIKGDRTLLATSPKSIYSNGKFAISAALKETIISNILSKEFPIPSFQTLAILDTHNDFEFVSEYLDTDDTIKEETFLLPSVIEIRVNKEKEFYRVSNAFINGDKFDFDYIKEYGKKIANIEAYKFCNRFLHGSWSVGNISTEANLIDFDTASFVKGRHPQYSNTNKYKSNYFGFEILGNREVVKMLLSNACISENSSGELEQFIDSNYRQYLLIYFCDLLGLDYDKHYKKFSQHIDLLFEKFSSLSRKFIPNYYDLNVAGTNCDKTFIFDFSNLFQNYLIQKKSKDNVDMMLGLKLLVNETVLVTYNKVGFIKDKVDEFFSEYIDNADIGITLKEATDFIEKFDNLFLMINKDDEDLSQIKLKAFLKNEDRKYLYGNGDIYWWLSKLYIDKVIDIKSLNTIINAIIKSNIRKIDFDLSKEYITQLNIYEKYLMYYVLSPDYYYIAIEPFSDCNIRFVKAIVNENEYMVRYDSNSLWISEKISYDTIPNFTEINIDIRINGEKQIQKMLLKSVK